MVNFTTASSSCWESGIARRSQSITPSRRVCRNLFGTVNHDELREEMKKQNVERLQERKLQYNFDFEKGQPLVGRYLWEKVSNLNRTKNCDKLTTEDGVISKTRSSQVLSKKDSSRNRSSKDQREQNKITDYFRSKKRKYEETDKDHTGINHSDKSKHTTHRGLDKACTCLNACQCI